MGTFLQDLRYGVRMLLKHPGFTVIAVLALALGIGANSAIFSVVNTVLLRPLPFPEPERLVRLGEGTRGARPERGVFSFPDYKDVQAQAQTLEAVAGYQGSGGVLTTTDGAEPERVRGANVSADYFKVLGVQPELGRVFTRAEDQPNATVIVISHGLWQRRFGANPQIIGQQLKLGSSSLTVVGVMPAGFEFPFRAQHQDFWEPINDRPTPEREQRDARTLEVIARLKPGVTVEQAHAELETISRRFEQQYPAANTNIAIAPVALHDDLTGDVRPALFILLGAVGLVLLIACANVANLLLARATARQKEIAIRTALGASRLRIVRQLLVESLLLALAGGGLGLLLAMWGVDLLVAASPADIPRVQQVGLDARVLAFTLALSALTGIAFGLVPALHASKPDLNDALKDGSRGSTESLRRNRVRSLLVVAEVALSLMLLIGAGLLLKSFMRLLQTDAGFDAGHVLTFDIPLSRQRYDTPAKQADFFHRLIERAQTLPSIETAGVVNILPLSELDESISFQIAGRPPAPPGAVPEGNYTVASPGYFAALKLALRAGRLFNAQDNAQAPPVALVSEALVRRYFAGENPIGQRLKLDSEDQPREIVGVVGDVRRAALETEAQPEYYLPYEQAPERRMNLVVRTTGDAAAMTATVRGAVKELDKDQLIWQTRTLEELRSASVASRRFNMMLLGLFAVVALLLAVLGIYGVMAYSVTRRTHEIGVRIALGAQGRDVLKLIIGQGMTLAVIGVGLGLLGALAITRTMASLLYGVSATDPAIFAGLALLLAFVALVACYVPARRATKVDPMVALRYE
ncbi:MAG: ABC transporter permease [Pyrinomonadaceae bacterium]